MAVDYRVITRLHGASGQPDLQTERSLGGGGEGTASWEPGRWVLRTQLVPIPPRTRPGDYQLSVALYESKSRTSPPVTAGSGAGGSDVALGSLRVR